MRFFPCGKIRQTPFFERQPVDRKRAKEVLFMDLIRKLWFPCLIGSIFLSGVLAMVNGIQSRSLLMDEAIFARNLDKFHEGYFLSSAPSAPLFYYLSHALVSLIGRSEWVYRLMPAVGAVLGFLLLSYILISSFSRVVALVSIVLTATSLPLVYYAIFASPFATDFFFSVVLLFIAFRLCREFHWAEWWIWIVVSAFAVTMSFSSVFVVTACSAVVLFLNRPCGKTFWIRFFGLFLLGLFVLFILLRFVFPLAKVQWNVGYWFTYFPSGYMPWSIAKFLFIATERVFEFLFWNGFGGLIGFFLMLLGSAWLIHEKKTRPALLCWGPIGFTVVASFMQKWPYGAVRTVLFLLPFFLFLIAAGIELVWRTAVQNKMSRILIVSAFLALLVPHSWILKKAVIRAGDSEEAIKSLSKAMKPEIRDGDRFMVYFAAEAQFRFYFSQYLDHAVFQSWSDRGNREALEAFVTKHASGCRGRFWLFFSHVSEGEECFVPRFSRLRCVSL
jgi:hypothetical protein